MNILKRELVLSIEVDSSIDVVWEVLTNFQNYPNWNPFITSISGELLPKKVLNITMNFGKKKYSKI